MRILRYFLHVVDELARMIAVSHGMTEKKGDWQEIRGEFDGFFRRIFRTFVPDVHNIIEKKMKNKLFVTALLSVCMLSACHREQVSRMNGKLENGWYHIAEGTKDSVIPTPIVTVKEFVTLKLDTDYYGIYAITGQVCRSKRQTWADATERWIGKRIGFVFNDSLITSPQVNMRIESGAFQISTPQGHGIKSLYPKLLKEKEDSIDALFKANDWEKDSLLLQRIDAESRDSLINALDYGEARAIVKGFED